MPETLDPFVFEIDAAFDAAGEDLDADLGDDPATSLLEYLANASERPDTAPRGRRTGRLVSLIVEHRA
jgi:hypothetical protein